MGSARWPEGDGCPRHSAGDLVMQHHRRQWCRQSPPRAPPACLATRSSPPCTAVGDTTHKTQAVEANREGRASDNATWRVSNGRPTQFQSHQTRRAQRKLPYMRPSGKTRARHASATQDSHTYRHVGPSRDRWLARASTAALGPKRERWGDGQLVDVPDAHQLNALRDALLITQRWKAAPRNTKREKKTAGTSVSAPCAQPNQQRTRGGQTIKAGAATAGQWRTMPHGVVPGHTARARGRPADAG